jgi:16S rRNA (guanine(966)-N(2))-methyltransferase RsmD
MRIVAGLAKGRKIEAPKGMDVRPTTDRVREALFSSIAFRLENARVLDLFAGTGALGIEALSRGAASCVFVDGARKSIEIIRQNIAACGFDSQSKVIERDALIALHQLKSKEHLFDIVFLDPPYQGPMLERALHALDKDAFLATDALIVAEHPAEKPPSMPGGLSITSTKRYGNTVLSFVQRISDVEFAEQQGG